MPLPSELTHTKWIAFFADLRSKISHHEPRVNVEGAELIRRLLMTQLGIAAFLEEDYLLSQLCTKLASLLDPSGRRSQEIPSNEMEAAFSLLQCLSEVVALSIALFNDKDPYYSLLVVSRMDSAVLKTLVGVLRSHIVQQNDAADEQQKQKQQQQQQQQQNEGNQQQHTSSVIPPRAKASPFFGFTLSIVQTIVSALPVASFSMEVSAIVPTSKHHPNGAAVRHVTKLIACCRGEDALREVRDTVEMLIAAQAELAADGSAGHDAVLAHELALRAVHEQIAAQLSGSTTFPDMQEEEHRTALRQAVNGGFDKIRSARCHNSVHVGLNAVWCCLVADGAETCRLLDSSRLSCLERFCRTEPSNEEDLALFRAMLSFFAALCHVVDETPVETQRFLIDSVCPFVISLVKVYGNAAQTGGAGTATSPVRNNNNASSSLGGGNSPLGQQPLSTPQFLRNQAAPVQPVERPSPTLSILLMLHVVCTSCRSLRGEDISRWVRAQGFLLRLMNLVEAAGSVSSPLQELPFAADTGALPDDRFLHAALETCRTDTTTSASVALKLVTELLLSFGPSLQGSIGAEMGALVKTALPLAVRIAVHHPTMSVARYQEQQQQQQREDDAAAAVASSACSVSMLHHIPTTALRSTRPCSVGESALLAIDTLVACALQIENDTGEQLITFETVAPWLPNLVRCTKASVQPHLRTLVHRLLVRVCRTPQSLRQLVQQLPSFTSNAAEIVLNNSNASWEVAGAAMWLSSVLRIATSSSSSGSSGGGDNVPVDMLLVPALPRNLLRVASSMPPSYGSGALLQLLCALAERHRQRHATSLPTNDEAAVASVLAGHAPDLIGSVVAPDGSASVTTWTSLLEQFTTMSRRVDLAPFGGDEVRSVTDDALFRARGALEEQTARTWYAAQLFQAVRILVERHRDLQRAIPADVLCDAVGTLLSSPLPSAVRSSLESKFAVSLPKPTQLLQTFDDAIRSGVALLRAFFDPAGVQQGVLPGISRTCMEGLCSVLGSVELAKSSRALVASFLNNLLSGSNVSQNGPMHSVQEFAASAFLATRNSSASDDIPAVVGLRCRLVSHFVEANHAATSCSWLKENVKRLAAAVHSIHLVHRGSSGGYYRQQQQQQQQRTTDPSSAAPNEADQTEVQVSLSCISSVLALPECLPMERSDVVSCAASLLALLKLPWAQSEALRACRAMANSAEGRAVLGCDLPTAAAASSSSPTKQQQQQQQQQSPKLSALQRQATKDVTGAIRAPFAKLVQLTFFGKLATFEDATCGTDAVSLATVRDPDSFSPWLVKFKVLDSVSAMLAHCSRQKTLAPLSVYRFLASATAAEEMRIACAHNTDVVELLVEAAEHVSQHGTLALMALRNLAFSNALKNQICTNTPVMHLFKRVMWLMPPNAEVGLLSSGSSSPTIGGGGQNSPTSPMSPNNINSHSTALLMGKHQLKQQQQHGKSGGSAAIAALHPNATAEEVLMAHAGNLELFRRQELAASALWALVDGNQRAKSFIRNVLKAGRPCSIDEVRAQLAQMGPLSDLPGYPEKVVQTLDILESHGLAQQPLRAL